MNINTTFPVGLHIYCFNNNSIVEKFLKRKEKKLDYINCKRNEVLFYISQHNTNAVRQRLTERKPLLSIIESYLWQIYFQFQLDHHNVN